MKRLTKIGLLIVVILAPFTSCKKEASTTTTYTVVYKVTWPATVQQGLSNIITYTNSSGNPQPVTILPGTSWTQTVVFPNASSAIGIALEASLSTALPTGNSTCNVKIYVNGVLKSQNSSTGSIDDTVDIFVVAASYVL